MLVLRRRSQTKPVTEGPVSKFRHIYASLGQLELDDFSLARPLKGTIIGP